MIIPGGVYLQGHAMWSDGSVWDSRYISGHLPEVVHYSASKKTIFSEELNLFAAALGYSQQRKDEVEAEEDTETYNVLQYFSPFSSLRVKPDGQKVLYLHAFRESEAAEAAFDYGLRTPLVFDGFPKAGWKWAALGKIQEKAALTAA